jgi:hypothetical protein
MYHYTTPHGLLICDSDGVTGNQILHPEEQYKFLQQIVASVSY